MRLASFDVENLFRRPRAMNGASAAGTEALTLHAEFNALLGPASYSTVTRRAILERLRAPGLVAAGQPNVAIVGYFDDVPGLEALAPLLGPDRRNASAWPGFDDGERPGTYGKGAASQKIDYLLRSPPLIGAVTAAGILRTGVWAG